MELYKHQQKLLELNPKKWLLAWECGTGKTLAAIELVKKNTKGALVVAPKSLTNQWVDELDKQRCNDFNWTVYSKEVFKKAVKLKAFGSVHPGLIIDEAHYFTGMQNSRKRSQLLQSLLEYIKAYQPEYIYLLTATPYLSTPLNIYALAEILGQKWNYKEFFDYFFVKVNMGMRWPIPVPKKHMEPAIATIVNRLGNTVRMDECVDVPGQVFQTEYFDLTAEQVKAIQGLTDTAAIAFWTKAHQICGGTLKSDGYSEDQFYKSDKMDRLLELCQEHKKLVIVCRYNNEIDYISKRIKHKKVCTINGSTKDKSSIVKEADQAEQAIVLVNAACSEGYELPSFPIMIFYSYDFSLKNYLQIIGRIQRINNIKKNVYISLVVKGTVDEEVYKCIKAKQSFDVEIYDKRRSEVPQPVHDMAQAQSKPISEEF